MTKEDDSESLRLEYKIAFENYIYYGKVLWQMASIFLTAGLAGFAFALQQDLPLNRFVPLNAVLTVLLVIFFLQARSLSWLAHLQRKRCEEIEKTLPMKLSTYTTIANNKELKILDDVIKPRWITGRIINQVFPILLLVIFWGYTLCKFLN